MPSKHVRNDEDISWKVILKDKNRRASFHGQVQARANHGRNVAHNLLLSTSNCTQGMAGRTARGL